MAPPVDPATVEIANMAMVGSTGTHITINNIGLAIGGMTPAEAIVCAAWIVTLTGCDLETFGRIVQRVEAT